MKHLQALASMGNNRADLLTFVSKVMMIYMNNPYPYMDRVTDLVSEVVAMTTGQTTAGSGKKELDRKIEGIAKIWKKNEHPKLLMYSNHPSVVLP